MLKEVLMARPTLPFLPIETLQAIAKLSDFEPGEIRVVKGLELTEDMIEHAQLLVVEAKINAPPPNTHYDGCYR